jgi:hypothetical protein
MNRILYFLTGGCVAGVTALAFFQKLDIGRISSTDVVATAVFLSILAAATCILIYSRWGRRLRSRLQQMAVDEDERCAATPAQKVRYARHPLLLSCDLRHRLLALSRKVGDHGDPPTMQLSRTVSLAMKGRSR